VVDFGFARLKPKRDVNEEGGGMRTPCFTLQYAAPEVLDQALPAAAKQQLATASTTVAVDSSSNDGYNESCDLWSLGVIMYALLSGRSPFLSHRPKEDTALQIMKRIRAGDIRMESTSSPTDFAAWKHVSPAAKQLVRGLLTVDPKKRLNLDDLFNSAWVKLAEQQQHSTSATTSARSNHLLSPAVLSDQPLDAKRSLMQTFNAFHRVTREGGMPSSTTAASSSSSSAATMTKLVISSKQQQHQLQQQQHQRSRCHKPQTKTASTSSSSGCSSLSSASNSLSSPTKQLLATPWTFYGSGGTAGGGSGSSKSSSDSGCSDSVLNYRTRSRIHDYLNSLSQIQQAKQLNVSSPSSSPTSSTSSASSHPFPSPSPSSSSSSLTPPPRMQIALPAVVAAEALSGVSYRLLPPSASLSSSLPTSSSHHPSLHHHHLHSTSSVSITAVPPLVPQNAMDFCQQYLTSTTSSASGPMTRSRKRRLKDDDEDDPDAAVKKKSFSGSNNNTLLSGVSVTAIQEHTTTTNTVAAGGSSANAMWHHQRAAVDLFIRASPSSSSTATAAVSLIPIKEDSAATIVFPQPSSSMMPMVTMQTGAASSLVSQLQLPLPAVASLLPPVTITID
jgi:hypothetical protein